VNYIYNTRTHPLIIMGSVMAKVPNCNYTAAEINVHHLADEEIQVPKKGSNAFHEEPVGTLPSKTSLPFGMLPLSSSTEEEAPECPTPCQVLNGCISSKPMSAYDAYKPLALSNAPSNASTASPRMGFSTASPNSDEVITEEEDDVNGNVKERMLKENVIRDFPGAEDHEPVTSLPRKEGDVINNGLTISQGLIMSRHSKGQKGVEEEEENDDESTSVIGLNAATRDVYQLCAKKTLEAPREWTMGHESKNAQILYEFKSGDTFLWFHAMVTFDNVTLEQAGAGAAELTEWHTWHPTVSSANFVGPRTRTQYGGHGNNSVALGLMNFDINTKLTRFIGPGYMIDMVIDAPEGDPAFVPRKKGMRRAAIEAYTLTVPLPGGSIMMIQHAKVDLQMALPAWLIRWTIGSFLPKVVQSFQYAFDQVKSEKSKYKKLMKEDMVGLYALLREKQQIPIPGFERWNDIEPIRRVVLGKCCREHKITRLPSFTAVK